MFWGSTWSSLLCVKTPPAAKSTSYRRTPEGILVTWHRSQLLAVAATVGNMQHNNDTENLCQSHGWCVCVDYSAGFSNVGMVRLGFSSLLSEEQRQKAVGSGTFVHLKVLLERAVCVMWGLGAASTFELHILSNVFLASAGLCSLWHQERLPHRQTLK